MNKGESYHTVSYRGRQIYHERAEAPQTRLTPCTHKARDVRLSRVLKRNVEAKRPRFGRLAKLTSTEGFNWL